MVDISVDSELTGAVIGAAIAIHRQLGPGLREVHGRIGPGMLASTYEECLCYELGEMDISFQRAMTIPLVVDGECLSTEALVPVVVANEVPVFPTCVESLTALHTATALARLRQGGWNRGLILNFHSETMLKGIKRVVL